MTDAPSPLSALSFAVLDAEEEHRTLLHSVVLVARAIFESVASSIVGNRSRSRPNTTWPSSRASDAPRQ